MKLIMSALKNCGHKIYTSLTKYIHLMFSSFTILIVLLVALILSFVYECIPTNIALLLSMQWVLGLEYYVLTKALTFFTKFIFSCGLFIFTYIAFYYIAARQGFADPFFLDLLCEDQRNFINMAFTAFSIIFSIFAIFLTASSESHKHNQDLQIPASQLHHAITSKYTATHSNNDNCYNYIEDRLDQQIKWYDTKSIYCQHWYKTLKIFEIVMAALIPIILLLSPECSYTKSTAAALGALISIVAAVNSLNNYQANWLRYRMACELLKQEKIFYLTASNVYDGAPDPCKLLVLRVEDIISNEQSNWRDVCVNTSKPHTSS